MKNSTSKSLAITAAVAVSAALLGAPSAQAQAHNTGMYMGASIGQAKGRDACDQLAGLGVSCDDKDRAWKLFVGFDVAPGFAVEGGYVDFGNFRASSGPIAADIEAKTWQLAAVGTIPMQGFSLFGKAGIHRWDAELRGTGFGADDNGTDFMFGFGAGLEFTRNLGMRVEWERFKNVGENSTTGRSDVDLVSLGLRYRF